MENQLNGLKDSLNNNVFKNITFSDEHREAVKEAIEIIDNLKWNKTTVILLLNIIHGQSVTGFEIIKILQEIDDTTFNEQEGSLYTILHRLENEGLLCSTWEIYDFGNRKYYSLTSKGRRIHYLANIKRKNSLLFLEVYEGGPA